MTDPALHKLGDSYFVTTPEFSLEFSQLREHADGLAADISATALTTGMTYWARVSLASAVSRGTFLKALEGSGVGPLSPVFFAHACHLVVKAERRGEPAEPLRPVKPDPARWLIPGWMPLGETTLVYGDGGVAKSLLCLAVALAGLTGQPIAETWTVAPVHSVLYLDWESQQSEHAGRWWGLSRPLIDGEVPGIYYRALTRPLVEVISGIRADVARLKAELVICDSLGPASGAEPESADAAVRTMTALRSLTPATRLVTAHVSKLAADQTAGHVRPFGSVFVRNLARSTVHAAAAESLGLGDEELVVTYSHTKANSGALQPSVALRYLFDSTGHILIERHTPDLARGGLPMRVIQALRETGQESVATLAEEVGASQATVRSTLARLEKRGIVVAISVATPGRGKKHLWGLVDTKRVNGVA